MEKNQKIMETLGDAVKLAANLTESTKNQKNIPDDTNLIHQQQANPNQSVQIHIDDPNKEEKKPIIIREKPETHIHKDFPDDRALTKEECELALKKAEMDNTYRIKQLEYKEYSDKIARDDWLERERFDRKYKEEQQAKRDKLAKIKAIIAACLGAAGVGLIGYSIYADHKYHQNAMNASSVIHTDATIT